jgi:CheY-like chemotaxis protein
MKKILVIDDNEPVLIMTKQMLELEKEYDVTTVSSGKAAWDLIRKGFIPNLVLLDLFMSDMGGWNTLLKIRKLCEANNTRIAIYSSSETPDDKIKAKDFGAIDFINKPMSGTKLLKKVAELLNR